jgi:hypothetical protein
VVMQQVHGACRCSVRKARRKSARLHSAIYCVCHPLCVHMQQAQSTAVAGAPAQHTCCVCHTSSVTCSRRSVHGYAAPAKQAAYTKCCSSRRTCRARRRSSLLVLSRAAGKMSGAGSRGPHSSSPCHSRAPAAGAARYSAIQSQNVVPLAVLARGMPQPGMCNRYT